MELVPVITYLICGAVAGIALSLPFTVPALHRYRWPVPLVVAGATLGSAVTPVNASAVITACVGASIAAAISFAVESQYGWTPFRLLGRLGEARRSESTSAPRK